MGRQVEHRIGNGPLATTKNVLRVEDLGIVHICLEAAIVSNACLNADIPILRPLPRQVESGK